MSTEITRKDRLAANMRKLQFNYGKYGHEVIGDLEITPETYILPDQMSEFKEVF